MDNNLTFDWRSLLKWLFIRVAFPLSPILVNIGVEHFFKFGTYHFPDQRVLIFTFLLPILYFQDIQDTATRFVMLFVSFVCLALYVMDSIAIQPNFKELYPMAHSEICNIGLVIFYVVLASAVIYEFAKAFNNGKG